MRIRPALFCRHNLRKIIFLNLLESLLKQQNESNLYLFLHSSADTSRHHLMYTLERYLKAARRPYF